jgi:hypothetical protein
MNKSNVTLGSAKGTSTLTRATFSPGMLLQHADLQQLNAYTRDLSRLLFKSLFGCGVVCGLKVQGNLQCGRLKITVDAGVALACSGDPIHVPKPVEIWVDEPSDPEDVKLWVVLCRTVKHCAPRISSCCEDDDASSAYTRERDGYEIQVLSSPPACVCGCPQPDASAELEANECHCANPKLPCYERHYQGECGCHCDDCSDCECKCVLLARLDKTQNERQPLRAEHRVRRFIRPVLMHDPFAREQDSGSDRSATPVPPAPAPPEPAPPEPAPPEPAPPVERASTPAEAPGTSSSSRSTRRTTRPS